MQRSLGTAVLFGMFGLSCFGPFFTRAFYPFIRSFGRKERAGNPQSSAVAMVRNTVATVCTTVP